MISFFVPGIPAPGGSKIAGFSSKTGRGFVRPASKKTKPWMAVVSFYAQQYYKGEILTGPLRLSMTFFMPRPKSHYGTGRNAGVLKLTAPYWHTSMPDRTKLLRSTEDALKGIVWKDDSQVCAGPVEKQYGEKTGVYIYIQGANDDMEPLGAQPGSKEE